MSMFKISGNTTLTDQQITNINTIPDLTTNVNNINNDISNLQQSVNQISGSTTQVLTDINSAIESLQQTVGKLNLVNDVLLIDNGQVVLSHTPLSNLVINNMYTITDTMQDGTILIVSEEIGDFVIESNLSINLNTSFYNGLELRVSYVTEGDIW